MSQIQYSPQYEGNLKISHEQINNSGSKQLYSFTKSKRFNYQQPACFKAYYDLPDIKDKRSALIGSGKKFPIAQFDKNIPGPQDYILRTQLEEGINKQKGTSFQQGRDKIKFGSMSYQTGAPGVGSYQIKSEFQQSANKGYSIQSKSVAQSLWNIKSSNPGPGAYNQLNTLDPKQVVLSTIKKLQGYEIPHQKRFSQIRCSTPGPGQYDNDRQKAVGQYPNSRQRSVSGTKFTSEQRQVFQNDKQNPPGPGSYRMYSEFGDGEYVQTNKFYGRMNRTYSTPNMKAIQ